MYPIINRKETGKRLKLIMDQRGVSVKTIQEYLGLACVQSVYHWLDGKSLPSIDNFYALSELFRIPVDEMIQGNRRPINTDRVYTFYERMNAYYLRIKKYAAV